MKVVRRVSICVLLLIPLTLAWAQDDQPERREQPRRQPTAAPRDTTSDNASQSVDSELATMLAIKNQAEIDLCRWALEKTQNDEVRQFAQKLIDDHTNFLSKLQQFNPAMEIASLESEETPTSTRTIEGQPARRIQERQENREERRENREERRGDDQGQADQDPPQAERNREATTETEVTRRTTIVEGGAEGQSVHLLVARETARRCLELTKEKLGGKEGQDFDRCFVGGEVMAHVGMVAKLQAQQKFASSEYRELLEKALQTTQQHLKHAESLAQKLEGAEGGANEGTTTTTTRTRIREENRNPNEGEANREEKPENNP